MTVRVLMKRRVTEDKVDALRELLDKMRLHAMGQPGYVSGETLKSVDAPGIRLVISKWKTLREWHLWFDTPERKAIQQQIDAITGEETHYRIYEPLVGGIFPK